MTRRILAIALFVAATAARPAGAVPPPEWAFEGGRSFAVGSDLGGGYDQGGFTFSGSALWPWENRFRFGVSATISDLGDQVQGQSRALPEGGTEDLGNFLQGHALAWGVGWRADALGPRLGMLGRSYATAGYDFYRLRADSLGRSLGATSALGVSLGVGFERAISPHMTLGLTGGGTWLSDDLFGHFATAALAWHWRW
jgi:hypothetical protein